MPSVVDVRQVSLFHAAYVSYGSSRRIGRILQEIRDYVDGVPNLYLVGRNGMHKYNNQAHSMLTTMTAMNNLIAGRRDKQNIWDVNTEQDYHESKEK